jgi:hypothetical protein
MIVQMPLVDPPGLLANRRQATGLTVLHRVGADPVDSRVSADAT